ncbi:MAG: (d)CMP kinase [Actinomycetes bacterium]
MTAPLVIAIDGPAGSGKSTVGGALAEILGLATLDTGSSYRAIAAQALHLGIDAANAEEIVALAAKATLTVGNRVMINGRDVTSEIRSEAVNATVSFIAANPGVRSILVQWQRAWVDEHHGGVVEGRDIGTVVFPNAPVKLFLTARSEERARRRSEEGIDSITRRDALDSTRATSPLTRADDAFEIDTTSLDVATIVTMVLEHIEATRGTTP